MTKDGDVTGFAVGVHACVGINVMFDATFLNDPCDLFCDKFKRPENLALFKSVRLEIK
jgi:hypothetical protein